MLWSLPSEGSEYYHMCAAVFQIGITPSGCGVFASKGMSPRLSDAQQALMSGAVDHCHPGGCMQVCQTETFLFALLVAQSEA